MAQKNLMYQRLVDLIIFTWKKNVLILIHFKNLILGPWSGENEIYHDPLYFGQYSYIPMTEAQLPPMPSARKRPRTDVTFINSM